MNTRFDSIGPIANVAYTINDKQYLTSCFELGTDCSRCSIVHCERDVGYCGKVIFKQVRESHKGRRCIKSDFKVGKVIWYVGDSSLSLDKCKLKQETIDRWLRSVFCMLIPFTTERAAKAYVAMRQKQKGELTNG